MKKRTLADWQKLELERIDPTWRQPFAEKQKVRTVEVIVNIPTEAQKQTYFHAGRFMQGATDSAATRAWVEYQRLENL